MLRGVARCRSHEMCFGNLTGDHETLLVLMNDDLALYCLQTYNVVANCHFLKLSYFAETGLVPQAQHSLSLGVVVEICTCNHYLKSSLVRLYHLHHSMDNLTCSLVSGSLVVVKVDLNTLVQSSVPVSNLFVLYPL